MSDTTTALILLAIILTVFCLFLVTYTLKIKYKKEYVEEEYEEAPVEAVEMQLLVIEEVSIDATDNTEYYRQSSKLTNVYLEVGDIIIKKDKSGTNIRMLLESIDFDNNVVKINLKKEDGKEAKLLYTPKHVWVKKGTRIEQFW